MTLEAVAVLNPPCFLPVDVVNWPCSQHQHHLLAFMGNMAFLGARSNCVDTESWFNSIGEVPAWKALQKPCEGASVKITSCWKSERKTSLANNQKLSPRRGTRQKWDPCNMHSENKPGPAILSVQKSICLSTHAQRRSGSPSGWNDAHRLYWKCWLHCWQTYLRHLIELITWLM